MTAYNSSNTGYFNMLVTANNSTHSNFVSFFVSDFKIVYYNNCQSSITMPWTREEKIFCVITYLETKSFKTGQVIFRRKFNLTNIPPPTKSQIYRWVHKFQATGSVNNLSKMAENHRSGRKLPARCPDNVDTARDSVGRSPKKSLRRRS